MKYNPNNHYLFLTFKGMLMGIADLVPGISGGTIALITGVYKDLITAISNINLKIFKLFWYQYQINKIIAAIAATITPT